MLVPLRLSHEARVLLTVALLQPSPMTGRLMTKHAGHVGNTSYTRSVAGLCASDLDGQGLRRTLPGVCASGWAL